MAKPLLELVALRFLVTLHRQVHQAVAELRVRDPVGLEELSVDARLREARDRVELVHEDIVAVDEEVAASEPAAAAEREDLARELPDPLAPRLRDLSGDEQLHPTLC